jgi:hypothetical protein
MSPRLAALDTGAHRLRAEIAGPSAEASTFECVRCGRTASTPTVFETEPCRDRHP